MIDCHVLCSVELNGYVVAGSTSTVLNSIYAGAVEYKSWSDAKAILSKMHEYVCIYAWIMGSASLLQHNTIWNNGVAECVTMVVEESQASRAMKPP